MKISHGFNVYSAQVKSRERDEIEVKKNFSKSSKIMFFLLKTSFYTGKKHPKHISHHMLGKCTTKSTFWKKKLKKSGEKPFFWKNVRQKFLPHKFLTGRAGVIVSPKDEVDHESSPTETPRSKSCLENFNLKKTFRGGKGVSPPPADWNVPFSRLFTWAGRFD